MWGIPIWVLAAAAWYFLAKKNKPTLTVVETIDFDDDEGTTITGGEE